MKQYQVDKALQDVLTENERQGKTSVIIIAGELNKLLPFTNERDHNRCPMCCKAMRKIFRNGIDIIKHETESGESPTFSVEYRLPR